MLITLFLVNKTHLASNLHPVFGARQTPLNYYYHKALIKNTYNQTVFKSIFNYIQPLKSWNYVICCYCSLDH